MATKDRGPAPSIKDQLFEQPYSFEFHQAIKILEMLDPEAIPYGESEDPLTEPVAVKSRIYFESLASDIYSLDNTGKAAYRHNPHYVPWPDDPPQMQVNFMGLAGFPGPLPYAYAENIIQQERSGDSSLRDFLDIFNHRLLSILHRTRKQYLIGLSPLSPDKSPQAMALRSFVGIGQKHVRNRMQMADRSFLEFAGLFWQKPHSAQALSQILSLHFSFPIRTEQCVGRWRRLHFQDTTALGKLKGRWNTLGKGAMLGDKIWDQQGKLRLHVGPLTTNEFEALLPGESTYQALIDCVSLFISPELDYDINLIVEADEIEASKLSTRSGLGWNTWLSSIPLGKDAKPIKDKKVSLVDKQVIINPRFVDYYRAHALSAKDSLLYENLEERRQAKEMRKKANFSLKKKD